MLVEYVNRDYRERRDGPTCYCIRDATDDSVFGLPPLDSFRSAPGDLQFALRKSLLVDSNLYQIVRGADPFPNAVRVGLRRYFRVGCFGLLRSANGIDRLASSP